MSMQRTPLVIACASLALAAPNTLLADTIHVPGDAPTIQIAINNAASGDLILVAPGTYQESINFLGKNIIVRSEAGYDSTTIDGEDLARVVDCSSGEPDTAALEGFRIIRGYSAGSSGGGMRILNSDVTVRNCRFFLNVADAASGGGLYIENSSSLITDCLFDENTSLGGSGGGIAARNASPVIDRCTFESNLSDGGSGGNIASLGSSTPIVANCLVTGGGAPSGTGGGIANRDDCSATYVNCTIADNDNYGAANRGNSVNAYFNCIVWGNASGQIRDTDAGSATVEYSNVQGGITGTGNIDDDPDFVSSTDYRLSAGSPCIDAGDNTAVPAGITQDLDGAARFADDPDTPDTGNGDAPIVDMGAYEFGAGEGFTLASSGSCPGTMTFTASGALSNSVAFAYARGLGSQNVPPSFPCAGVTLGLDNTATLLGTAPVVGGVAEITRNVPGQGCGRVFLQALDLEPSCAPSNVILVGN